jgi:hypothetical protein
MIDNILLLSAGQRNVSAALVVAAQNFDDTDRPIRKDLS